MRATRGSDAAARMMAWWLADQSGLGRMPFFATTDCEDRFSRYEGVSRRDEGGSIQLSASSPIWWLA